MSASSTTRPDATGRSGFEPGPEGQPHARWLPSCRLALGAGFEPACRVEQGLGNALPRRLLPRPGASATFLPRLPEGTPRRGCGLLDGHATLLQYGFVFPSHSRCATRAKRRGRGRELNPQHRGRSCSPPPSVSAVSTAIRYSYGNASLARLDLDGVCPFRHPFPRPLVPPGGVEPPKPTF